MRYIKRIKLRPVVKRTRQEAERVATKTFKVTKKYFTKTRRSLKKTFSKKRNQRRAVYVLSAVVIVSLLFGYSVQKVQSHQEKQQLYQSLQTVEQEKHQTVEQLQTLSKDLQTVKEQKAVQDTQLQEKAATDAQKDAEIQKLKAEVQAKADEEARIAALPKAQASQTGGMGGSASVRSNVSTSGNTYSYGYCTWYVKNRRSDIPNSWGNANAWYYSAQSDGWPTGSTPKAGAIGTTTAGSLGHVVYVERVNGDGTILISEMNYQGWGVESTRTTDASEFAYIY